MQKFDPDLYPSLAALDQKVVDLLSTKEAKAWGTARMEYEISRIHPVFWMETFGFIRAGEVEGGADSVGIIPFRLNTSQLRISDTICSSLLNRPWSRVQVLILKHRKVGTSTLMAGFNYWFMRTIRNFSTFAIADLSGHTDNISAMVELFHQRDECGKGLSDEKMRPPRRVPMPRSKKGLRLSNGSMLELDTGENANPGTSGTIQGCHMSENSKWRDPQTAETSLLNSIPRKGFAFIVKESTAFGLNKFAQDCELAEKGMSNWEFVFVSWKDLPDCEYDLLPDETLSYTPEEKDLAEMYNLRPGHVKFRRSQIELLGSEHQFRQDFPLNSREPFLITGSNFFNVDLVKDRIDEIRFYRDWKVKGWDYVQKHYAEKVLSLCRHPRGLREALNILEMNNSIPQTSLLTMSTRGRVTYDLSKQSRPENGAITFFRLPIKDHDYVVAVDVAEGKKTSDYTSDNSIIEVFDARRREQVAEWGGTFDEEMTALYAVMVARLFNNAIIVPEMNNRCGGLLQANLEKSGYRHVYHRQRVSSGQTVKREFGWLTTRGNKSEVCGRLRQDFKNRDCLLHSIPLLEEMGFFIDTGKSMEASPGHRDDRVMCASVGLKMIESTPSYHQPKSRRDRVPLPTVPGSSFVRDRMKIRKEEAIRRYM